MIHIQPPNPWLKGFTKGSQFVNCGTYTSDVKQVPNKTRLRNMIILWLSFCCSQDVNVGVAAQRQSSQRGGRNTSKDLLAL